MLLQSHRFEIKYRKGRENHVDGLSGRVYDPIPEDPDDEITNHYIYFSTLHDVTAFTDKQLYEYQFVLTGDNDNDEINDNPVKRILTKVCSINQEQEINSQSALTN